MLKMVIYFYKYIIYIIYYIFIFAYLSLDARDIESKFLAREVLIKDHVRHDELLEVLLVVVTGYKNFLLVYNIGLNKYIHNATQ